MVNHNNQKLLEDCLLSVFNQDYTNFEVIVVDNDSSDSSTKMLEEKFKKVKLIKSNKNLYFAAGNNLGYKYAKGEIIFLLNNDTIIENNLLTKVINYFNLNSKCGIIQNELLKMSDKKTIDSAGSMFTFTGFLIHRNHNKQITEEKPSRIFAGKGASLFIKREVIEKFMYLFDENFLLYFEDTDLCWRANLCGYDVIYLPGAKTYHYEGMSTSKEQLAFIDFHSFKNRLNSIITNLSLPFLLFILPTHILCSFILAAAYLPFRSAISKSILKSIFWNIKNFKYTLRKRIHVQKLRKISDIAYLPKVSTFPSINYIASFFRFYSERKNQKVV